MAPFFSVILPVYNVENDLERCIQSVLTQNFKDFEIILVDDGSTDSSGEICDRYAATFDCIRVIHKENGGLSSARNTGMEAAVGRYIWWVDSDDWIREDALSVLHRELGEEQPDILKFDYIRVTDRQTELPTVAAAGTYKSREERSVLLKQALTRTSRYILSACSHIYRREFLLTHSLRFVSERIVGSEDYLFNLQALLQAETVCVVPQFLYFYEQRMGSLTQRYRRDCFPRYTELYRQLMEYCQSLRGSETYLPYIYRFYAWHLVHGICIPNGYYFAPDHTVKEGRKELRTYLRLPELSKAIKSMDQSGLTGRQKLQLQAMKWQMEWVFYWLYAVKPGKKKGTGNEN